MKLQGKTAVITGGAKGIGEGIALLFAKEGANLILIDMDEMRLAQTKIECEKYNVKVLTFVTDITDVDAVNNVAKKSFSIFESIDIIVNNAGVWEKKASEFIDSSKPQSFLNITNECWQRMININIMGAINVTRAFLQKMIDKKYGKIINIASVAGINGIPGMSEYSATKGAIIAFTKALAHEIAEYHVNVNAISPGSVATEGRGAPLSYLGISSPSDMANAVMFFASSDSDFITGQNLAVDGGRTLSMKCD